MQFRTEVGGIESKYKISYNDRIILMGSCFSENIGSKLNRFKFNTLINPLGTIYNPFTLCKLLMRIIVNGKYTQDDLVEDEGLFLNHDLHSQFNDRSAENFLKKIHDRQDILLNWLKTADFLFLTLGTSIVHQFIKSKEIVGNCHKVPNKEFETFHLDIEVIVSDLVQLINALKQINPNLNIIFTVSPVRHTRSGIIENSVSKSRLIVSVNQVLNQGESIAYFPAYEIMMDDLRDYRFYQQDLIHPNEQAVDYIWSIFETCFFSEATMGVKHQIKKIIDNTEHRAFNPASPKHQHFLLQTLELMKKVEGQLGRSIFSEETRQIRSQIIG